MKLFRAEEKDSDKLLEFYQDFQLAGPVQLEISRGKDFFSLYKSLGRDFRTYCLEEKELKGLASFVIFDRIVEGEKVPMAYALDFRLLKSRKTIMEWSKHFQPILEEIREEIGCKYFLTSLHRSQAQAYNAFVRPRNSRRGLPRYNLFRNFRLITVHGLMPFSPKPLESLTYRHATESDRSELIRFYKEQAQGRAIQLDWENEGFSSSLERFPGLSIESFILAIKKDGRIAGAAAPWSLDQVKKFVPLVYSARAENFRQFLKLSSWMRFARPLPKPSWKNPDNQSFQLKVLTHLRAEHEDIFESLLTYIWQSMPRNQFLAYCYFDEEYWLKPPLQFITASQKFNLYNIIPVGGSLPEVLTPIDDTPLDLELIPLIY